jgi:UDP-N-acetylglucosamine diphosphorylase/glucosamine-1-phosphate N-acetyltransferase
MCIFEDSFTRRLLPLTYLRPVYDLRCGILTLREKLARAYPGSTVHLHVRGTLKDLVAQQHQGILVNRVEGVRCLFLNGRVLASGALAKAVPPDGPDGLFVMGETLVAARISGKALDAIRGKLPDAVTASLFGSLPVTPVSVTEIRYPWDLINHNGEEIRADFALIAPTPDKRVRGTVYPGAHLVSPGNIVVGEGSKIKPGVVLDAEGGPIFIGSQVTVFPNAVIEGPAFIGDRSLIKVGAKIYENTSIGEVCKVGGEVEASIIHAYSNKQHDGFLGHAYLGMWVNLGADTNNSDLKNNYGSVKLIIDGETVDSGSMFMGLVMGDHSKSSINSMFNTGTVVGVSSNVFGSGFPPKSIPSFAWGGAEGLSTYDLEKALEVARRVMGRRKMALSGAEENAIRSVFAQTEHQRKGMRASTVPTTSPTK